MTTTITTYPTTAEEAVARGAALLDDRMPGWADRIDLPNLELKSTCNCVLGQLYPPSEPSLMTGFDVGVNELDVPDVLAVGFDILSGFTPWDYAELDAAWTAAILERRGGAR